LKYYRQVFIQGDLFYILEAAENIQQDFGTIGGFKTAGDGIFYAQKYYDRQIIRFRSNLKAKVFLSTPQSFLDMSPGPGGLGLLKMKDVNTYQVLFYDSTGVKLSEFQSDDSGLRPERMKCFPEGFALAGSYGSGPASKYNPDHHYTGRGQGWFRYFPEYNFEDIPSPISLAVTDIIQQAPIAYDSVWSLGWDFEGFLHSFVGGGFSLNITNTGNEPVYSFWVNIAFDLSLNTWFCAPFMVKQLYVDQIVLLPGESSWIDFGDIEAYNQENIPKQFGFWTSGNNSKPDFHPEDDVYCMDRILATKENSETTISIYPNPANTELNILCPSNQSSSSSWKLIDVTGRIVTSGNLKNNYGIETIETTSIPPGIYYFRMDHYSKPIIIQH